MFIEQKTTEENADMLSKTNNNIHFKQRVFSFLYYQPHIICKCYSKIMVYNVQLKKTYQIYLKTDDFVLDLFHPYVFNCIIGQHLQLYSETALFDENDIISVKISKLEVKTICRYNGSYYMGGYNRSSLPGGIRTTKKKILVFDQLSPKINNKAREEIILPKSESPIEIIEIQNPFLVAYCRPNVYILSVTSHQILLKFEKPFTQLSILEGRYAMNTLNGMGLSINKTLSTFDLQKNPIYGIQVNEHNIDLNTFCVEKTGRLYCGHKNAAFEYNPLKRIKKCVMMYPMSETIIQMLCTNNNNLLVLKKSSQEDYAIDVFNLE